MSTGTDLIEDALKEIGANSVARPAGGETINDVKKKLDSMLQRWLSQGIDLGTTPIDLVGEEVNEPIDARNAIVENLAILAAPLLIQLIQRMEAILTAGSGCLFQDHRI